MNDKLLIGFAILTGVSVLWTFYTLARDVSRIADKLDRTNDRLLAIERILDPTDDYPKPRH